MRRAVLILIVLGVPLLWGFAPIGRMPPAFGMDEPGKAKTFADTFFEAIADAADHKLRLDSDTAVAMTMFPGLLAPLYPSLFAALLLVAPRRLTARRRWVWLVEGVIVLLFSPIGALWAVLSLSILIPGAGAPSIGAPLWLLPGFAALGALAAIWIGIARPGRIAHFLLGQSGAAQ